MKLQVYLELRGLSHAQFAEIVGASPQAVSLWATDQRIPTRTFMDAIKESTTEAVTANDFFNNSKVV